MEYVQLENLFEIKVLDLSRLSQSPEESFLVFDYDNRVCDFIKPVILISSVKPLMVKFVDAKCELSRRVYCLLNMAPEVVSTKYIYYYLCGNKDLLDNLYMGYSIENLSLTDLRKIEIKVPPMSEQMKCVKHLDVLERLLQQREESKWKVDDIFSSYYEKVFSVNAKFWEKKELLTFTKKKIYGSARNGFSVIPKENGVLVSIGKRVFYEVDKNICNPYFLTAALENAVVAKYSKKGSWTNVAYYGLSISNLDDSVIPLPYNMEQQYEFQLLYEKLQNVKENMDRFMSKLQDMYEYYLFEIFYRDTLPKDLAQSKMELDKLRKTIIKYSYKDSYLLSSLMAYDEVRQEEYKALKSGNHKQIFDEKTGKISIIYP